MSNFLNFLKDKLVVAKDGVAKRLSLSNGPEAVAMIIGVIIIVCLAILCFTLPFAVIGWAATLLIQMITDNFVVDTGYWFYVIFGFAIAVVISVLKR